jgi:hypothetical protein
VKDDDGFGDLHEWPPWWQAALALLPVAGLLGLCLFRGCA